MLLPTSSGAPPGAAYRLAVRVSSLERRQSTQSPMGYVVLISIIGSILAVGVIAVCLRTLRSKHPDPKYIPTQYLKSKWMNWRVPSYRGAYQSAPGGDGRSSSHPSRITIHVEDASTTADASNSRPNRNTSVRSVMTLPAYTPKASNEEQVLGREGDRDGIDVVLELPTTEDAEEVRNAEMEQLYQIRLLRRQWNQDRERRRELRRDARARGDVATLERLRDEARAARDNNEMDELRRELEDIRAERDNQTSVVSYADVGVARADGTRIRANSVESERVGLLSDAASIGVHSLASPRAGARSATPLGTHRREISTSSVLSFESAGGDDFSHGRSRSGSASQALSPSLSPLQIPTSVMGETDLGEANMPPHSPPGYEDVDLSDRSGATTPHGPPPDYPGPEATPASVPTRTRSQGQSAPPTGLGISVGSEEIPQRSEPRLSNDLEQPQERRLSRGGGVPQLPILQFGRLPQIVVQSTGAHD